MNHAMATDFCLRGIEIALAHDGFLILLLLIREREKAAFLGFFC